MVPNPDWPADKVVDEDSWADVELLKILQVYNGDPCFCTFSVVELLDV